MSACKIVIGVVLCILLPGCLQCAGFLQNKWAASPNVTCQPFVKLYANNCIEDFETIFFIELIPTLVFLLPVAALVHSCCGCANCTDDEGDGACLCASISIVLWLSTPLCILAYPFVGILILTGCIMFSTHYETSDLELSFFLCLSAGCFHIIGLLYLVFNKCCKKKEQYVEKRTNHEPERNYIPSVSRRVDYMEETRHVAHDPATGTTVFSRNFKFISIFE